MKTDAQLISERLFTFLNERNITVNRLATLSDVPQTTLNGNCQWCKRKKPKSRHYTQIV